MVTISLAQSTLTDVEAQMNSLFEQKKYYQLLAAQDDYFKSHPDARDGFDKVWILAQRMYSWMALNDMLNLRAELRRIDEKNPSFADLIHFRAFIDDKFQAEMYSSGYLTEPVLDPGRDYRPALTACDTVRGALNPERSCYDVTFYDLSLMIDPETREIAGRNKISFIAMEPASVLQVDLFAQYHVSSVRMNDATLDYSRHCNAIFVTLPSEILPGEKYNLEIEYDGTPRVAENPPWNGGFVWKENKGKYWAGVACEHLGASSWWPVKDHLSDKPDSMRITLRVPDGYQAVANGNLRSVKQNDDQSTSFEWFIHYPVNSYNVTFYLGNFVNFNEIYNEMDGPYQIDYYVLKNHLKKAKKYYAQTHTIFEAFSGFFGEYPFPSDGAGFVESPYTGMEHQGAIAIGTVYGNTFRSGFIPDYDLLLVHETAHEWWGNAVAVGDMADAWISEGFATYAEMMFIEKMFGYQKYLDAVGFYAQSIVNAWPMVGDRDVNDNTFITNDIYFKGAAMLNNLRCILDDDSLFFSLIKGFFQEYKLKITDSDDFTSYLARYYEGNLDDFFDAFLYQDTPPVLEYSFAMAGGSLLLTYRWIGVGQGFTMPFCIVINDNECVRLVGTTSAQRFSYNGAGSFYIPNPFNYSPDILDHNSFTYFQTHFISH